MKRRRRKKKKATLKTLGYRLDLDSRHGEVSAARQDGGRTSTQRVSDFDSHLPHVYRDPLSVSAAECR